MANAVLDGADALMLSGETSVGDNPQMVVETMAKIIEHVEEEALDQLPRLEIESQGSTGSAASAESSSPSVQAPPPSSSGAQISAASSDVAEGQRMESAADMGGSVNSQTITNNSNSVGKEPTPQIVDVYDSEFAKLIAA